MRYRLPAGLAVALLLFLVSVHSSSAATAVNPLCPVIDDEDSSCLTAVAYDIGDSMCEGEPSECVTCLAATGLSCSMPEGGSFTLSNTTRGAQN